MREVIWRATIDADFRADLLNGSQAGMLNSFGLGPAETQALLAIRAQTLPEYAAGVLDLMGAAQGGAQAALIADLLRPPKCNGGPSP
jgi:hypothetical protein